MGTRSISLSNRVNRVGVARLRCSPPPSAGENTAVCEDRSTKGTRETHLEAAMTACKGIEVARRGTALRTRKAEHSKPTKTPLVSKLWTRVGSRIAAQSDSVSGKGLPRSEKRAHESFQGVTRVGRRAFGSLQSNATARSVGLASNAALEENAKVLQHAPERSIVVVIDNYDSFTYNLCQYMGDLGCQYVVFKNDELSVEEIRALRPRGVLVSPGPGTPDDSGIALQAVRELGPEMPLFGVCMGHQCIGQVFGGNIVRAPCGLMHGKTSPVYHNDSWGILKGMDNPFTAARYHSLVISQEGFPDDQLEVTAWTEDRTVMACRHKVYRHIQGVQFHPESIITENGLQIIRNWMHNMDEFYNDK